MQVLPIISKKYFSVILMLKFGAVQTPRHLLQIELQPLIVLIKIDTNSLLICSAQCCFVKSLFVQLVEKLNRHKALSGDYKGITVWETFCLIGLKHSSGSSKETVEKKNREIDSIMKPTQRPLPFQRVLKQKQDLKKVQGFPFSEYFNKITLITKDLANRWAVLRSSSISIRKYIFFTFYFAFSLLSTKMSFMHQLAFLTSPYQAVFPKSHGKRLDQSTGHLREKQNQ